MGAGLTRRQWMITNAVDLREATVLAEMDTATDTVSAAPAVNTTTTALDTDRRLAALSMTTLPRVVATKTRTAETILPRPTPMPMGDLMTVLRGTSLLGMERTLVMDTLASMIVVAVTGNLSPAQTLASQGLSLTLNRSWKHLYPEIRQQHAVCRRDEKGALIVEG